jgi:Flp pilus assembly pilin Flp
MMKFSKMLERFSIDESGAVTVDWVVLTAGIVGLGLVVLGTTAGGITEASVNVAADIQSKQEAATALNSD